MILGITTSTETNIGTSEDVSVLLRRIIKNMKHHMNTKKRISKDYNSHTEENPIYGTGQGATDSPPK
eukprot:983594-Ditylum_brightwellii.AAC.1